MRDGRTCRIETEPGPDERLESYLRANAPVLVLVSGDDAGEEFAVERAHLIVGRGDGADLRFDDGSMSSEHAALEFQGEGYRLRDLGSMNGCFVNGAEVMASDLKHGDEIRLGGHTFTFVVEARERRPRTYEISTA
jgi:pSer/pThr/pTyr-binding forkhead associated (FHA) protein